jgi:hypothetical protein
MLRRQYACLCFVASWTPASLAVVTRRLRRPGGRRDQEVDWLWIARAEYAPRRIVAVCARHPANGTPAGASPCASLHQDLRTRPRRAPGHSGRRSARWPWDWAG